MKTWHTNNRQFQENLCQSPIWIKQGVQAASSNRLTARVIRNPSIDSNPKSPERKKRTQRERRSSQVNPTITKRLKLRKVKMMCHQTTASRTKFSLIPFNRLRKLTRKNSHRSTKSSKITTLDKNRSMRLLWIFRASFPTSACRLTKTRRIRADFSTIQVQKAKKIKTKVRTTLTTRSTMKVLMKTVFSAAETCLTTEAPIVTSCIKPPWTKLTSSPSSTCSDRVQGFRSTTSSRSIQHSMMEKARANMKPSKETSSSRHLRWIVVTISKRRRRIQGPVCFLTVLPIWGRELWMLVHHTILHPRHSRLNSNRRALALSWSRSLATFQCPNSSRSRDNRRWKISILNKHRSWRNRLERRGTGKWMQLRPRNDGQSRGEKLIIILYANK